MPAVVAAQGKTQDVQKPLMKTSVIDVHDMLSVLSVDDLEQRIRQVPGGGSR